jgi:D-alanyl-D-alanine carboxypeptidase
MAHTCSLAAALALCLAFAACSTAIGSNGVKDPAALKHALDRARLRHHAPAATAAVFHCGKLVWSGASGVTALRGGRPARVGTRFVIASNTKPVTATMILQLVAQGKLSLDQPLSDFYPDVPNASRITIRQLLQHRSGLAEYTLSDAAVNDPSHRWTRDEAISGIGKPQFAPGTSYRYTNSNYLLLGGILEKVTGKSIEQLFRADVAGPAKMSVSSFSYRPRRSGLFAHPYELGARGSRTDDYTPGVGIGSDTWGEVWTDGGLSSTAPELGRFSDALFHGKLLPGAQLREMTTFSGPDEYGLGIYRKDFGGHRWIGHDGEYGGFESESWHDSSRDVTISLLTNLEEPESADKTISDPIWSAVATAYDRQREPACNTSG